jgi:hypothetical protein
MSEPPLHPDLEPLAFLIGAWEGEGKGDYPTISPFVYRESLTFWDVRDTFLLYRQESWSPEGEPIHFEQGVLRPLSGGRVDLVLAHPIGVVEVSEGTVDGTALSLATTAVARSSDGSPVTSLARRYRVDRDTLSYEIDMAMEEVASTLHVWASLTRKPA